MLHYWHEFVTYLFFFFNLGLKFQNSASRCCHDLAIFCLNIGDIAIITAKNVYYFRVINNIKKSAAINLLENPLLPNCGYIEKKLSAF